MCENRLGSYFKKKKKVAYENYPSYQFFPKEKKYDFQPWRFHQFKNNRFFSQFSQVESHEFQYSFLENLVLKIIVFEKIIKFEYIFNNL
jgi:hypothetical protein